MNPYLMLGSRVGSNEAQSLGVRLSAWHDAMVAHERRLRAGTGGDVCDDECPHAEARTLWPEAQETFGARAGELGFLRARAQAGRPRTSVGPRRQPPGVASPRASNPVHNASAPLEM